MANIPANSTGIVISTTTTGSYAGFTVVSGSNAVITGLKDFQGNTLATAAAPMVIPAGFTVPIFVTSASLSTGAVLFYY
jgi:hypothetical protein